jgi:hypothetical protein
VHKKLAKFGISSPTRLELMLVLLLSLIISSVFLHSRNVLGASTVIPNGGGPTPTPTQAPSQTFWVGGYIYQDLNNNKDRDANEKGFSNQQVSLTEINSLKQPIVTLQTRTDVNGYFLFKGSTKPGVVLYSVQASWPSGWKNSGIYSQSFAPSTGKRLVEFGLTMSPITPTPTPNQTNCSYPSSCLYNTKCAAANVIPSKCSTFYPSTVCCKNIQTATPTPTPNKYNPTPTPNKYNPTPTQSNLPTPTPH